MTISVIIPAYNAERFIGQAITSALDQYLSPDEIIVIDDGSTDKTREIVRSFGSKVQYFYQENAGSGRARNVGIFRATSEFIAFLDSDDYWDRDHLAGMIKILYAHPESCMAYCGKKWVDEKGSPLANIYAQKKFPYGWIFRDLFVGPNPITSASVVVARKNALTEVGGFDEAPELRNAQDYQLWLRMSALHAVASSSQETVNYRRHDTNRTLDVVSYLRGHIYALETTCTLIEEGVVHEKNEPALISISKLMKQEYRSAIMSLCYNRQYHAVHEFCVKAFKKAYWSKPLFLCFLFSILPSPLRRMISSLRKRARIQL